MGSEGQQRTVLRPGGRRDDGRLDQARADVRAWILAKAVRLAQAGIECDRAPLRRRPGRTVPDNRGGRRNDLGSSDGGIGHPELALRAAAFCWPVVGRSRQKSPPIPLHRIGAVTRSSRSAARSARNRIRQRGNRMSKTTFVMAALAGVMAGGAYVLPAAAQAPSPIAPEPLTLRSVLVDDIGLKIKIKLDGEATDVVDVKGPSLTVV